MQKKSPFIAQTEDRLFEYAAWYFGKYAPSRKRLIQRLTAKSADPAWVDTVIERLDGYISDGANLESRIASDLEAGRTVRKIREKYAQKGFSREDIGKTLSDHEEDIMDFETRSVFIRKKMESLSARGKSKKEAEWELGSLYMEFRDEVRSLIQEEYPDDRITLEAFYTFDRTQQADSVWMKKFYEKLQRKGFSYADIAWWINACGGEGVEYSEE